MPFDPYIKNKAGERALFLAAQGGHTKAIEALVSAGFAINGKRGIFFNKNRDKFGGTPLHTIAATNENPEIMAKLLDLGGNPNARNSDEHTPLTLAIANENQEVALLLIEQGSDINSRPGDGRFRLRSGRASEASYLHLAANGIAV